MANITFKKGKHSNLQEQKKEEGAMYLTTDKHELWADVSASSRVKIIDEDTIVPSFTNIDTKQCDLYQQKANATLLNPSTIIDSVWYDKRNGIKYDKHIQDTYLPLSGGALSGNLTGQQLIGTLLRTTAATNLGSAATKIAVLRANDGYIYYRTPAELRTDIGAANKEHSHNDLYYTENEIDSKLNGKANVTHSHNDLYYTESEIDSKLNDKANTTHSHNYLPLDGGTLTGKLTVNSPIFGYGYSKKPNTAAFIFDKPGNNYSGIGADSVTNTIRIGACDIDGKWLDSPNQTWKFYGEIYQNGTKVSVEGHTHNKKDIGLDKVDNTADKDKSVKIAVSADNLTTARTFTIGKTGKSFDGSANVSWSLSEIGAASISHGTHIPTPHKKADDLTFLRDDNTWYRITKDNITSLGIPSQNTTYSAGSGLSLSKTTFNANFGKTAGTICEGNDPRLSDSRKASDVKDWAKQPNKPTYSASEVGAAPKTHSHNDLYYTESEIDSKLNGKANATHSHTEYVTWNYNANGYNTTMIQYKAGGTGTFGHAIGLGGGGLSVLGGGESVSTILENYQPSAEMSVVSSDTKTEIVTNLQDGYASRKTFVFDNLGSFFSPNGVYPSTTDVGNLGNYNYRWQDMWTRHITVSGPVRNPIPHDTDAPKLTFCEGNNIQPVHIIYTDSNSYRSPAGLKICGGTQATPAWLEVEGDAYAKHVMADYFQGAIMLSNAEWGSYGPNAPDSSLTGKEGRLFFKII